MRDIEIRQLGREWRSAFAEFCRDLDASGDTRFFQPHPFTEDEFDRLSNYRGQDLFYLVVEGPVVLGYGLLRGWDEGYAIPSLGIAIRQSCRSDGLGTALMHFLHTVAKRRGARQVRLRVRNDNDVAKRLYERLGYLFVSAEPPYLVGFKDFSG